MLTKADDLVVATNDDHWQHEEKPKPESRPLIQRGNPTAFAAAVAKVTAAVSQPAVQPTPAVVTTTTPMKSAKLINVQDEIVATVINKSAIAAATTATAVSAALSSTIPGTASSVNAVAVPAVSTSSTTTLAALRAEKKLTGDKKVEKVIPMSKLTAGTSAALSTEKKLFSSTLTPAQNKLLSKEALSINSIFESKMDDKISDVYEFKDVEFDMEPKGSSVSGTTPRKLVSDVPQAEVVSSLIPALLPEEKKVGVKKGPIIRKAADPLALGDKKVKKPSPIKETDKLMLVRREKERDPEKEKLLLSELEGAAAVFSSTMSTTTPEKSSPHFAGFSASATKLEHSFDVLRKSPNFNVVSHRDEKEEVKPEPAKLATVTKGIFTPVMSPTGSECSETIKSPLRVEEKVKEEPTLENCKKYFNDMNFEFDTPKIEKPPSIADKVLKALSQQQGHGSAVKTEFPKYIIPTPIHKHHSTPSVSIEPVVSSSVTPVPTAPLKVEATNFAAVIPILPVKTVPPQSQLHTEPPKIELPNIILKKEINLSKTIPVVATALPKIVPKPEILPPTTCTKSQDLTESIKKLETSNLVQADTSRFTHHDEDSTDSNDSEHRLVIEDPEALDTSITTTSAATASGSAAIQQTDFEKLIKVEVEEKPHLSHDDMYSAASAAAVAAVACKEKLVYKTEPPAPAPAIDPVKDEPKSVKPASILASIIQSEQLNTAASRGMGSQSYLKLKDQQDSFAQNELERLRNRQDATRYRVCSSTPSNATKPYYSSSSSSNTPVLATAPSSSNRPSTFPLPNSASPRCSHNSIGMAVVNRFQWRQCSLSPSAAAKCGHQAECCPGTWEQWKVKFGCGGQPDLRETLRRRRRQEDQGGISKIRQTDLGHVNTFQNGCCRILKICDQSHTDQDVCIGEGVFRTKMDQNEPAFLLDPRCRLCRTTDTSLGRIPVAQNDRKLHQFVSEMISSCTVVKIYDYDRLPQHVCGRCLEELREVYAFWKRCVATQTHAVAGSWEKKEEECYRCRICHVEECDELYSIDCPGSDGEVLIIDMLQAVTNEVVGFGDGLPPYLCNDCLNQLEAVRDFQRMCLETEEAFLSDTIHAWEKMEFQEDQPTHLVVDLFAKPLFESSKLVRCSVCGLERPVRDIKSRCEGCLLDFCDVQWPDYASEQDSSRESECEREEDEEVEVLVVMESGNEAESDGEWTPAREKRPRMKSQLPVKRVVRKTGVKGDKIAIEDSTAVPTKNISKHLERLQLQMEDHFEIVSSPPGANHQTMRLKTFLCCGCDRFFLTEEAFRQHLRMYHEKRRIKSKFTCNVCNTAFFGKVLLQGHKEKLDSRLYNYCKACDIVLLEERSFVRHQMVNHLSNQQLQQIETQFLRKVKRKCLPDKSVPDGKLTCDDCAGKFSSVVDLCKHQIEIVKFVCQQKDCNYGTKNREFMIVHCAIGDHRWKSARKVAEELIASTFEEPSKVIKEVDEDDSPDWNPEQNESDGEQERSYKRRNLSEKIPGTIPSGKCAASLKEYSLTMEDVFDIVHSTPGGTHQYIRRKMPFCCGCNLFLINEEALLKHRDELHPKQPQADPKLTCPVCRTTLPTKKRFTFHRDKKDWLIYNYCIPCDRVFLDEKSFTFHHYNKHISDRQCAKLERQFTTVTVQKCKQSDYRELTGASTTDFRCVQCLRYFATKADLQGHQLETVEFGCLDESGCDFKTKNRMAMIVHCSIGDHRQGGDDLMKGMSFKKMATTFNDSMPVTCERMEDLSQAMIPSKKLQIFLKGNSLQMEDIFEVLGTIENSYLRCMKLRRKKPLCCACNVMFMSEQALSAHLQKEHSARPPTDGDHNPEHVCKLCFTVCNIRIHKERLKGGLYTYCKLCDCLLLTSSFARHNVSLHLTAEKLREIEDQFTTLTSFGCRDADALCEIREGNYVCVCKCGKKFDSFKSGKAHKGRSQDTMLYCKVEGCGYQTNRKPNMYEHCMEEAHGAAKKVGGVVDVSGVEFPYDELVCFKCCVQKCYTKYRSEDKLLKHLASAHGSAPVELDGNTCRYCRDSFSSEEELRKHADRRYNCKIFKCPNFACHHRTEYATNMQLHFKTCKKTVPSNSWKCPKSKIPEFFVEVGKLDDMIDIIEVQGAFCCGCRRVMESEDELKRHLQEQHGTRDPDRQFHCSTCNKGFKVRGILENHIKESAERRYFYCRICSILLWDEVQVRHHKTYIHAFEDPSDLTEFYDTVTSDGLPCCGCDAAFETQDDLAEHCRIAHPPPPKINRMMCPHCFQQFPSNRILASHSAMYGCPLYYKCKIGGCTLQTKSLAKIERHVSAASHEENEHFRKHLANPQTFYCCVLRCTFSSESYDLLIDHGIAEHEVEREERSMLYKDHSIVCPVCCKGFDLQKTLINHRDCAILRKCEVCSGKIRIPEYQAHLEQCRKTYSKKCAYCSQQFSTNHSYYVHFKKHHAQKLSIRPKEICNICGERVARRSLADHIASHENKRAWKCDLCSQRFNTKAILSLHIRRVHTTERKYHCTVEGCGKTYRYDIDRIRHEMVVHFNDKPFACAQCSETFVRNRDLQLHMRQHTGRRLYSCTKCRAEFDLKRAFVEHEEHCEEGGEQAYEEFIVEELV